MLEGYLLFVDLSWNFVYRLRIVLRLPGLRGLRRLRGMQRQLPKCLLGLYLLQYQLQRQLQRELFGCMQEFLLERLFELIPHWRLTCSFPLENRGCST